MDVTRSGQAMQGWRATKLSCMSPGEIFQWVLYVVIRAPTLSLVLSDLFNKALGESRDFYHYATN